MNNKVWYVTGASKGLGLTLVKRLLKEGYCVAATSRSKDSLQKSVVAGADSFLALEVDLLDELSIAKSVTATIAQFGRIDVVVNNAGFGMVGALEELSDAEARTNFDINVFGSLNVIRQVLPQMRQQKSGHIFNISSIGGYTSAFPGFGIYCATKFAVQGFTGSLAAEVKPFGINATVVYPGYFRTEFLSDGSLSVPQNPLQEYELVRQVQDTHQNSIHQQQAGDPEKAAAVMIQVAELAAPPVNLFLGKDAFQFAAQQMDIVKQDMATTQRYAAATDINE